MSAAGLDLASGPLPSRSGSPLRSARSAGAPRVRKAGPVYQESKVTRWTSQFALSAIREDESQYRFKVDRAAFLSLRRSCNIR